MSRICKGAASLLLQLATISIFLLMMLQIQPTTSINWIAMGYQNGHWNRTRDCSRARKQGSLIKQQVMLCRRNLELMPVVAHSARESVKVCKELFRDRRWNCSTLELVPNYMADLTGGGREQGFVFALSSAAVMQATAKACSLGATTKCGCGRLPNEPPPGNFKWGGCGDDVRFGFTFSRMFADAAWMKSSKRTSKRSMVNLHNSAAGREIVSRSLATDCKCHGVSGSCSVKTCWKALPDLRGVGLTMQKRYAVAVEVESKKFKDVRKLVPVMRNRKSFEDDELIFYTKSPDYCLADESVGSLGTRGRECDRASEGSGGCRSMCCGRGYTSEIVEVKHRCECKYYWCCYVKCKTCTKKVEINKCR